MPDDSRLIFGVQEEWSAFHSRHTVFLERFTNLRSAIDCAFAGNEPLSEPIDKFIFLYGRICAEEFFEILLCCGNGYGFAAQKLLRSLYEKAVTLVYLHQNPEQLDDFIDYHHVASYKLARAVKESFGTEVVPEAAERELKEHYEAVKERFVITSCDKCKTTKLNHTWSKLDFVSMAKKVGPLGDLLISAYYLPLQQAHSTYASLLSRMQATEAGISFVPYAQKEEADDTLISAHNIALAVLEVQRERLHPPELEGRLQICIQDFFDIYQPAPPS